MALFQRRDLDEYTDSLAAYMPGGQMFGSRYVHDSNFRRLLRGMANELFRANGYLRAYTGEVIPDETEKFVPEWESALGIPDRCFGGDGTLAERRRDVLIKLAALGVQTAEDFEALGALFGVSIAVRPGRAFSVFPLEFPVLLFNTDKEARFTIVVDFPVTASNQFPLTFPFVFGDETIGVLECLFNRLKPANCNIIFRQV